MKAEVWVRVPTKGWKFVRGFKTLPDAVDLAEELEPLEVKVHDRVTGRSYYGGRLCTVDYSVKESRTLDQAKPASVTD